jgi:hypothetical protein
MNRRRVKFLNERHHVSRETESMKKFVASNPAFVPVPLFEFRMMHIYE